MTWLGTWPHKTQLSVEAGRLVLRLKSHTEIWHKTIYEIVSSVFYLFIYFSVQLTLVLKYISQRTVLDKFWTSIKQSEI